MKQHTSFWYNAAGVRISLGPFCNMDNGCLQRSVTSRLHTARPYSSPYHPHSTNLTRRLYSSEKEDPKLVSQPEVSTHPHFSEGSDLLSALIHPSIGRLTGALAPHVTVSGDGSRLSPIGTLSQAPSETLDVTCFILRGNRRFIKSLEAYYKAGAADIADVETVFQDYKKKCISLHFRMDNAKEATGRQLLIESGNSVLNKIVRTFMTGDQVEPLSPLDACAAISSGRFRFNSSVDFIRNSEFTDKAGLEQFLAEYPDLEDALNMFVDYLSWGMEFTAIAPFTVGTNEYDNVTMDFLQQALDDAVPAEEFGDDVRQPLKTLLKCLQDLSTRLDENLFV